MIFGVALEVLRKQSNCWDKITECSANCEECECHVDASNLVEAVKTVLDYFPTQMSETSDNRSEKPNDCDMTLDEAIQHAEDVAKAKNDEAEEARLQEQDKYADECIKCATEHWQLAEWLAELAVLREKVNCSELPNSSDDCVSRQAVIDRINWWFGILKQNHDILIDAIKTMPSVQAEQKKGHWIPVDDPTITGRCSVCGFESHLYEDDVYGYDYCPNCGARLEVIDE